MEIQDYTLTSQTPEIMQSQIQMILKEASPGFLFWLLACCWGPNFKWGFFKYCGITFRMGGGGGEVILVNLSDKMSGPGIYLHLR